MQRFQIWAQPWWVNLVLFVPVLSYLGWRRKGLLLSWHRLSALALFGAAFGFVEAVVVVYLRTAADAVAHSSSSAISQLQHAPTTYQQAVSSLAQLPRALRTVEVCREAATMIMLLTLALLAGARARERWSSFLWTFAVWDLIYYAGLWGMLRWPTSLTDYDVLFLIPVPWIAQVSASSLLVVALCRARGDIAHANS
jgi:hypothetical protein